MRRSIREQVLIPILTIQAAAIAAITQASVRLAEARVERQIGERLDGVLEVLYRSDFPLTGAILDKMRRLSGAEFIAYGEDGRPLTASTPGLVELAPSRNTLSKASQDRLGSLSNLPILSLGPQRYFAALTTTRSVAQGTDLMVLYPESSWREARRESAEVPLLLGGCALASMAATTTWIAQRLRVRLNQLIRQVASIAEGNFRELEPGRHRDEVQDLARSINQMSVQLREMREAIGRSERATLLAQLAAGLAHQMRNALTGARMSLQLHVRRCDVARSESSLTVALRQLVLVEEQVRGLLTLGRVEERPMRRGDLGRLLDEVATLLAATCDHTKVTLRVETRGDGGESTIILMDEPSLRSALLNMALNAIEAAGPAGSVGLELVRPSPGKVCVVVEDDGAGPSNAVAARLFEPFVTGKPEGVGLGLALARHVARVHDGTLTWAREGNWTRFRLELPLDSGSERPAQERAPDESRPDCR